MLSLARSYSYPKQAIILKNISKEEEIPIRYLEQIIIPLKINKLVKSIRGAGGGYFLARPPEKIQVYEILEALEGPVNLVDCVENPPDCSRSRNCVTREIWREASLLLRDYFQKTTLHDLLLRERKKKKDNT